MSLLSHSEVTIVITKIINVFYEDLRDKLPPTRDIQPPPQRMDPPMHIKRKEKVDELSLEIK